MKRHILLLLVLLTSATMCAQNVNGDEKVDCNDVTEITNYLMGKQSVNFDVGKADVNGDTKVNVADIVMLVNMLMASYDSQSLVVWKNDGTKDYFDISKLPETSFDGNTHIIRTANGETMVYDKKDVLRYSFSGREKASDPKPTANDNEREAFYVYQNDGHFDGFFYDEIQKMSFSKVDTLGLTHTGIVSQEIATADSTYRIMLSAIDSIGFVQPEILFNPRFRNLDEMGVSKYLDVQSPEYMILRYPHDYLYTQDDIINFRDGVYIPEEGDVIASFTKEILIEGVMQEGFLAKVTKVNDLYYDSDDNLQFAVRLTKVDSFGDVFYQFITTERLYADEEGNVHRRIAGCNEDGTLRNARTRAESGDVETTLISLSTNIQREYEPKEGVNVSLGADISLKLGMRVSYNISWRRLYVKFEIPADFKLTPKVGVKTSTDFEWTVDGLPKFLKAIKFPPQCPFLQTLPLPELVIRGGGELAATISFPSVGFGVQQNLVIDTSAPQLAEYWWSKRSSGSEADENTIDTGSAEISLSGYLQAAMKLSANIETCDWFSDLLFMHVGLDLYVGPKLEGSAKLTTDMFKDYGFDSYNANLPYRILSDAGVTITPLSCDLEAKGTLGYLFKDKEERTFLTASLPFFPTEFHLIPKMNDFTAISEAGYPTGKIISTTTTSGRPLIPTQIGARIRSANRFDWEEFPESQMTPVYANGYHTFTEDTKETPVTIGQLPPGRYWVQPVMKTLGYEYSADEETVKWPNIYVWPRFFTKANVTISGGKRHTKNHSWGKKKDGTTFNEENEADEDLKISFDVDVDCDENDGVYTITADISEPEEYNNDNTSDPENYSLYHSTYLTKNKLTMKLKVVDNMLYVTNALYEHGEDYSNTRTDHSVYHGEYYDRELGENVKYTNTSHEVSTTATTNKSTLSFGDLMIPFEEAWAGNLDFKMENTTVNWSSAYKRDDTSNRRETSTANSGSDKTITSESHDTEESNIIEDQPVKISVRLTY